MADLIHGLSSSERETRDRGAAKAPLLLCCSVPNLLRIWMIANRAEAWRF